MPDPDFVPPLPFGRRKGLLVLDIALVLSSVCPTENLVGAKLWEELKYLDLTLKV